MHVLVVCRRLDGAALEECAQGATELPGTVGVGGEPSEVTPDVALRRSRSVSISVITSTSAWQITGLLSPECGVSARVRLAS